MTALASPKKADRAVFWCMLLVLIWLPMPWGGHVPWATSFLTVLVSGLLAVWLLLAVIGRVTLDARRSGRLFWPMLIWVSWIGWIVYQIVPIGLTVLAEQSPKAYGLYKAVTDIGFVAPSTISIGKGTTIDALLLSGGYFGLYWLVILTCWRQPERLRLVLAALVFSGLAQALYGSLMTLSGLEYGFLGKKIYYLGVATGTFVNRNHLAGYLELTAAAGVGLILADLQFRRETPTWKQRLSDFITLIFSNKIRVRVALAIMTVGMVLTRSRMGNTAFIASLCICGLGYVLLRERQIAIKAILLFTSLLLIDVMIVSNWFGLAKVVDRIEKTEVTTEARTELFDELPPVVASYTQTGSGLGTFAQAYAPFRTSGMTDFYDHAHNDYLEFLIEVGLPGFFILIVFVGGHALHALHVVFRRRSRLPAAVCFSTLMAITAYAIHSTVDFNLQIPANAATFVTLLALCACCSSTSGRDKSKAQAGERDEPQPAAMSNGFA